MEQKIELIVKWGFVVIGIVMLKISISNDLPLGSIAIFLGLLFTLVGGGLILVGWWKSREHADLLKNGKLVFAEFQQVELNMAYDVNGKHPFRIVSHWHDIARNELHIFKSANLWVDPSPFINGKGIPVYVDPNKPGRYSVDLSFLPKVID